MPDFIQPYIDRAGGPRRAMIGVVGITMAILIVGLSRWATSPTWVPAFTGLPLEEVGALTEKLQAANIQFRLEQGGAQLMVPASDLAKARVALAQAGLPNTGRPGLELFDQPSWGMTDFTQRVNYRRALEGELERTIGKMRGVAAAQVHLALHEAQSFRRADATPSQASVVLKLRSGETPPSDVVRGIAHLVASSVDGLESEHVTVLDEDGRLLTSAHEAGSLAGMTSRQLEMQQEVEQYLEVKAQGMVSQLVGPGNARVQVAAAMNFDRVERTTQTVDPDKQAIATEQRAEITPGAEGGAASSNAASSYENSRSVENVSGAVGNVTRLSVAVLLNDRLAPAADSAAPPSVVARTPEEIARIETLVRGAVGYDSARGDVVSVVSMPFAAATGDIAADAPPTTWDRVQEAQRPILGGAALLLAFIVALVAIRAMTKGVAAPMPALAAPGGGALPAGLVAPTLAANSTAGALPTPERGPAFEQRPPSTGVVLRDRILSDVEQNPELAARLVRNWMKES